MVQLDIDGLPLPRLTFAWKLAQRFEADLVAFSTAEGRVIVPADEGGMVAADLMRRQIEEIEQRLKDLKEEFQDFSKDDSRMSWRGHVGIPRGFWPCTPVLRTSS